MWCDGGEEADPQLAQALHMSKVVAQQAEREAQRRVLAALAAELVAEQPDKEVRSFFDLTVREGVAEPQGATPLALPLPASSSSDVDSSNTKLLLLLEGVNFAVYAPRARHRTTLCIFLASCSADGGGGDDAGAPDIELQMVPQLDGMWSLFVGHLPLFVSYGYRVDGDGHINADPYTRLLDASFVWGRVSRTPFTRKAKIVHVIDRFPRIRTDQEMQGMEGLVIYEMHVRGFTIHPSSRVNHPGQFFGVCEKVSYLKKLGVNAVELLPVFEFDETDYDRRNPHTGEPLFNYWGYSSEHFFSPMARYASPGGDPIGEFRQMVQVLHDHGIQVILDVVYNHTGGFSLDNLANEDYYILDAAGHHTNYSGCGNTFNCNSDAGRELILSSLRYWVEYMGVDGFRFDEATILTRDGKGRPNRLSPLVIAISHDPVLKDTKLIAEAWDAAGEYQVGDFAGTHAWSEWNGKFRDTVRNFIKGTDGFAGAFGTCISGGTDTYSTRPSHSINYVTCHDGFSLHDLVSFSQKYNTANGEENRDGIEHNLSWNCGAEGFDSVPEQVLTLRRKQMRNFMLALAVSRGIPMLCMGDEYGHSKMGNNNTWCQDNELNWFLWDRLEQDAGLFRFCSMVIRLRQDYEVLHRDRFVNHQDIEWLGLQGDEADWSHQARQVLFMLKDESRGVFLFVAFNTSHEPVAVNLPSRRDWRSATAGQEPSPADAPPDALIWMRVVDTARTSPDDILEDHKLEPHPLPVPVLMQPYSAVLFRAAM